MSAAAPENGRAKRERTSFTVLLFRHIIPAAVVLGGLIAFAVNPSITQAEGAAGVIGAGLAWWLFGWLYRQGERGDAERDVEEAQREYLDEHGRWPSDAQVEHYTRHGRWPDEPGAGRS